jgi:hypothetical protein
MPNFEMKPTPENFEHKSLSEEISDEFGDTVDIEDREIHDISGEKIDPNELREKEPKVGDEDFQISFEEELTDTKIEKLDNLIIELFTKNTNFETERYDGGPEDINRSFFFKIKSQVLSITRTKGDKRVMVTVERQEL